VTNGSSVPLRPVGFRPPLLPVLLLGLALGIVIGLGVGRATSVAPASTATPRAAGSSPSATARGAWVTGASVAPDLMQAYYATRETSAGLAPVVCTTDQGLACQGVPARLVADVESKMPASPQIPGPSDLWPALGPAHLAQAGGGVHAILIDDLSPALYSEVVLQVARAGQSWTGTTVTPVNVNGAVVVVDLGRLAVGQYVVLIRQVLSVPPDPHGLVETWSAIGIEVDP
jgi:hypothetical protein